MRKTKFFLSSSLLLLAIIFFILSVAFVLRPETTSAAGENLTIEEDYTTQNTRQWNDYSNFITEVVSGNKYGHNDWGLVPGGGATSITNPMTNSMWYDVAVNSKCGGDAYVTYKLSSDAGYVLNSVNFEATVGLGHMGGLYYWQDSHSILRQSYIDAHGENLREIGANFIVKVSTDNVSFTDVYTLLDEEGCSNGGMHEYAAKNNGQYSSDPYVVSGTLPASSIKNTKTLYVRFYIRCFNYEDLPVDLSEGGISLNSLGALLYGIKITAKQSTYTGTPYLAWADETETHKAHSLVKKKELNTSAEVGKPYTFHNLEMYDALDGIVGATLNVYNPYGKKVDGIGYSSESFVPEYEGNYTIEYVGTNSAGNTKTDSYEVQAKLQVGAYKMYFNKSISTFGRIGKALEIPAPTVKQYMGGTQYNTVSDAAVNVSVTTPSGTVSSVIAGTYIPAEIGKYTFSYSTVSANGLRTVNLFVSNVKIDVDPANSYKDILNPANWKGSEVDGITQTENGIKLNGQNCYSELPFLVYDAANENKTGIEFKFDLSELQAKDGAGNGDPWFGFGIGNAPKSGRPFGNMEDDYIYFMIFKKTDGNCYVTALWHNIPLCSEYNAGSGNVLTIGITKIIGSPTKSNELDLFINHAKISQITTSLIPFSDFVDDEYFGYINTCYNGSIKGNAAVTLTKVTFCDQEAPTFNFSEELPDRVNIGSTVNIPNISVTDNIDEIVSNYRMGLYAPDGKEISLDDKTFVADIEGIYYFVGEAVDKAGNRTFLIKEIKAGEEVTNCVSGFRFESLIPAAILFVVSVTAFTIKYRKKSK